MPKVKEEGRRGWLLNVSLGNDYTCQNWTDVKNVQHCEYTTTVHFTIVDFMSGNVYFYLKNRRVKILGTRIRQFLG